MIRKILLLILIAISFKSFSQIDSIRTILAENLGKHIYASYVSVEIAKRMSDTIIWRMKNRKYDSTLNPDEFLFAITKDLRRVSRDNHIAVVSPHHPILAMDENLYYQNYNANSCKLPKPDTIKKQTDTYEWRDSAIVKVKKQKVWDKFLYGEIKILPGNIGYMEIKGFDMAKERKEKRGRIKFKSVMNFLRNTNSIIIDFRENLGGYINMAAELCSYFAPTPKTYFTSYQSFFRFCQDGQTIENSFFNKLMTKDKDVSYYTKGKRIYILTSKRTFSAGELSTYKLKRYNPTITLIGEKTTGGGNGYYGMYLFKSFDAVIPNIRVYDENNSNFSLEAIGVTPDIKVNSDSAFVIAYRNALPKDFDTSKSKTKYFKKKKFVWDERRLFFKKNYADFVGNYGKAVIVKEDDDLYLIYDTYYKTLLIPDAMNFFLANGFQYVTFKRDSKDVVKEIQLTQWDDYVEKFRRK